MFEPTELRVGAVLYKVNSEPDVGQVQALVDGAGGLLDFPHKLPERDPPNLEGLGCAGLRLLIAHSSYRQERGIASGLHRGVGIRHTCFKKSSTRIAKLFF